LPVETKNGTYLPSQNGTYYFRVYSIGTNGALSSSSANGSIPILGVNPLQDIVISSLQLYTGTLLNNNAGVRDTTIYDTSDPKFTWQVGLGNLTNIPSDLSYRISFRKPSTSNTPDKEIYFQETGYTSSSLIYTFGFSGNYNAISTQNKRGPFRDFDVVVEAMDINRNSSAGGHFSILGIDDTSPSNYSNTNGYDILYANNPKPQSVCLYTGTPDSILVGDTAPFYSTGKATQQWITPDGEIKIFFTNSGDTVDFDQFFGDDIAGATLYYSNQNFTQTDVLPPTIRADIKTAQITSADNPIIYPANLTNVEQQYLAIAPFDDFDIGINKKY
jgi:hypothetical protein